MKSFALVAFCAAAVSSVQATEVSLEDDPQQQLSMILAASQQSLSTAEHQHNKVMKKAKKELKVVFANEAKGLAAEIARYDADLQAAASGLAKHAKDARAAMTKVPEAPAKPGTWDNADTEARAILASKLTLLESEARKLSRKREYDLSDAVTQAKSLFETAGDELSRKLGDMSKYAETAQASFDNIAPANTTAVPDTIPSKVTLAQLTSGSVAAKTEFRKRFEASEQRFAEALKKSGERIEAEVAKLKKDLDSEEQRELVSVRTNVPKISTHLRAHKKATPTAAPQKPAVKLAAAAPQKPAVKPAAAAPQKPAVKPHNK